MFHNIRQQATQSEHETIEGTMGHDGRQWRGLLAAGAVILMTAGLYGQAVRTPGDSTPAPREEAGDPAEPEPVVIVRETLRLTDPKAYQVPLQLAPIRALELSAPVDGVVQTLLVQPGQSVAGQAEAVRLDATEQQLLLEGAKARHKAAEIELRIAKSTNDADAAALAVARLQAAQADLDLATHRQQRMVVRVPFAAEVFRVHAVEGQPVRVGDRLAAIGDTSKLTVEIPVDRSRSAAGQTVELRIEDRTVTARVETLLPPDARFEPLRELAGSIASAAVVIDNAQGQFHAGQTVYAPLIPRQPVAELATDCLANGPDGGRLVQVVRDGVIRDVPVSLLAPVGADRTYVSGPFVEGDEVIVTSSRELLDGTLVRAGGAAGRTTEAGGRRAAPAAGGQGSARPAGTRPPASQPSSTPF